MPTLKAVQRLHRIKKDGTAEIQIRVSHNRKTIYVRTGYYVKPAHLIDGVIKKHPESTLLNLMIEDKKAEILQNLLRQDLDDKKLNLNKATGKKPATMQTMFGAIQYVLKTFEIQRKSASYRRMLTNLSYIKEAWGKDIYIDDIKITDVEKFVNYRYQKGNSNSTVKKNLIDLSSVLNHIGYKGDNLFMDYSKKIKADPIKREKLTYAEIRMLENVKLSGLADLARDMYLFSFYTHGMRFENVSTIKREDVQKDHIFYRMNKGHDHREIAIHPKLKAIIQKYIKGTSLYLFPVVKSEHNEWNKKEVIGNANTLINKYLLNAARIAGIEKHISFHTARHTFAYLSKKKMVHVNVIQDALGHSKQSTTQGYLKSLDDDTINNALSVLYE